MNASALILGIILGIAIASAYYASQIETLHKQLQEANTTIDNLKTRLSIISNNYAKLRDEYTKLEARYKSTLQELTEAKKAYNKLYTNYTRLLQEYEKEEQMLKATADDAQRFHDLLLEIQDETLYRTVDGIRLDPDKLSKYIDWWTPEVRQATIEAIESTSLLPKNALTKIFDWVTHHIKYSYDSPLLVVEEKNGDFTTFWAADYWRKASETIRDGHGDCEDMAILVAAMVKAYAAMKGEKGNPLYEPMLILLYGPRGGHAFTALPAGRDKIIILDPAARIITGKVLPIWHQVEPEPIDYAIDTYLQAWRENGITYTEGAVIAKLHGHYYLFKAKNIDELKEVLRTLTEKYYQEG